MRQVWALRPPHWSWDWRWSADWPDRAGAATEAKSTTTTVAPKVAAEAKAALLTLTAFPSGWMTTSSVSGPSRIAPVSKQLASCIGASKKLATEKPVTYSSPDFTNSAKTLAVEDNVSRLRLGGPGPGGARRRVATPRPRPA